MLEFEQPVIPAPALRLLTHNFGPPFGLDSIGKVGLHWEFLSKYSSAVLTIRVHRLRNQQVSGSSQLVGGTIS